MASERANAVEATRSGRILSVPPEGEMTAPHPSPLPSDWRGGRPDGSRVARGLSPQPSLHRVERGRRGIARQLVVLTRCAHSSDARCSAARSKADLDKSFESRVGWPLDSPLTGHHGL